MTKPRAEVVEIKFGTQQHAQILAALQQRERMSEHYMADRYPTWKEMEERFRAYVNLTENDKQRKSLRQDGKPQYVTIDVPYSYAMLLTAHTYWTSVFLGRNPVLQYLGISGQTTAQEQAIEALINYQLSAGGMMLPLYFWFMDAGKYGLGVLGNTWCEEYAVASEIVEVPATYYGITIPGKTKKVRQVKKLQTYEGNKVFNIRPQDYRPDPRVPLSRQQDGEFNGRMTEVGWNTMVKRQAEGWYYNLDELQKRLKVDRSWLRDTGSQQLVLPASMDTLYYRGQLEDGRTSGDKKQKGYIELMEMTVELAPRDWGLGESTYPEKWAFTVANDEVIVMAMPTGSYHGKFENFVLEYEIEAYALSKRSMLEIVDPLNGIMSWLFNSHMYNVRKAINDQVVVDPSRITLKDFTDPVSGRIIRVKPEAYGTDVRTTYAQMQMVDITQNHMKDVAGVAEMMQRVLGVTENVMGMVNPGGRKTATEVRTSSSMSVNRLKTNCEFMSSMGFTPWAEVVLQNTQQRFSGEKKLRIAGRGQAMGAENFIMATPESIAGRYDFVPVDGTMPIDRFAQANLWKELAQAMRAMPEVAQQFDWVGIMGWIAQLSGAKNFDQFRINTRVVPDEAAAQAAQAGNVVPIGGPGGPGKGPGGAGSGGPGSIPGAPVVSRVGPVA